MSQGYEPKEILPDYLPSDKESGGNAVLMFWANPLAPQHATVRENGIRTRLPASVRVATVQFHMRRISQISEFEEQVEYFVDVRSEESRVGKECVSQCRSRCAPDH